MNSLDIIFFLIRAILWILLVLFCLHLVRVVTRDEVKKEIARRARRYDREDEE